MKLSNFIIVTGHYGSGKTNFALNLAINRAKSGRRVSVVDLDIVNPYFRTADYRALLTEYGIKVVASPYAGSTLDIPALSAEMYSVFDAGEDEDVIIDVGGDDAGASALGRFSRNIGQLKSYDMVYVINKYRKLIADPNDALTVLREIEAVSRVKATKIVNNSHLSDWTKAEDIISSEEYAQEISRLTGLPVCCTTAPNTLVNELEGRVQNLYGVDICVKLPW